MHWEPLWDRTCDVLTMHNTLLIVFLICRLQDFNFFLKENYDVRGVLMFGIRVDHHRVSQLLSVLGSAIVISVGYGVRNLLE